MAADAAFASLTQEIAAAREALLELAASEPRRQWHPYELKTRARNGWSASAMTLALEELIEDGRLLVSDDMLVSVPTD